MIVCSSSVDVVLSSLDFFSMDETAPLRYGRSVEALEAVNSWGYADVNKWIVRMLLVVVCDN